MKKSILIFIENNGESIQDVSLELLSKGNELKKKLNTELHAAIIGDNNTEFYGKLYAFGVDIIYSVNDGEFKEFKTLTYTKAMLKIIKESNPQIILYGATNIGRDLAPRIASSLKCGLTADCTDLRIGDFEYMKKTWRNLLYQIRPAWGGNIIATIVNPEMHPQMATVREGVMHMIEPDYSLKGKVVEVSVKLSDEEKKITILKKIIKEKTVDLKGANIIVSGGAGMGSKGNFSKMFEFAKLIKAEVGASRAAVDFGFISKDHQVGQTGTVVKPRVYFAFGISGAVQHRVGMENSGTIIAINSDPDAPIFDIAHIKIVGDINTILPLMIKTYKEMGK
ncbi:electron transfer flavoprotein subunit alpha [candidate division TA06 bacterium]|uniref:Electron transfer flavoprotein subunit alpha n=1 Tax=candidate division TA06 bacterium TaxID=2250710 RepID=A0A660SN03_UNCT6|nr:MAG: electron transfer flavoprotein subunit alpha [candidate division TA06 bacterium]